MIITLTELKKQKRVKILSIGEEVLIDFFHMILTEGNVMYRIGPLGEVSCSSTCIKGIPKGAHIDPTPWHEPAKRAWSFKVWHESFKECPSGRVPDDLEVTFSQTSLGEAAPGYTMWRGRGDGQATRISDGSDWAGWVLPNGASA